MTAAAPTRVTIACITDQTYADGALITLASTAAHLRRETLLEVFILDCGLQPETRDRLAQLLPRAHRRCTITFRSVAPAELAGFCRSTVPYITQATYAKLLLPRLLPECDRCLYLDSDLYVDADLGELFATDLRGHPVGAVPDTGMRTLAAYGIKRYLPPGTSLDLPAFNAGVLLLDLALLRERPCFRDSAAFAGMEVICADQALLNLVFAGDWLELPARWNHQVALWPHYSLFRDAPHQVWHIYKQNKPWHFQPQRARGLVADCQRSARHVGWTPLTRPHLRTEASPWRDLLKWSRAAVCRRLRAP